MLFSETKKFVFIAVPKTGTTSIELEMRRLDPDILRNEMVFPDGSIRKVNKHITLRDVQKILGNKASEYRYFAFMREPVDHTISRYYYYANGRGRQRYESRAVRKGRLPSLGAKVWFARLVPRPLWFVLYPLRQQTAFIRNREGRIALDFCGRVDRLHEDLTDMLRHAGYENTTHEVPHLNIAPRNPIGRLEQRFIRAVLDRRLKSDLAFFKELSAVRDAV